MRHVREMLRRVQSAGSPSRLLLLVSFALFAAGSKVATESRVPSGKEVKPIQSGNEIHGQT
jgi:hypothetical protein